MKIVNLLYNNSFMLYMRTLGINLRLAAGKRYSLEMGIGVFSFIMLAFVPTVSIGTGLIFLSGGWLFKSSFLMYFIALYVGCVKRIKPTTHSLLPISYKKRSVYAMLSIFALTIFIQVLFFVGYTLFFSILSVIMFPFIGEWIVVGAAELIRVMFIYDFSYISLPIYLCLLFSSLIIYGMGIIISYMKKKAHRYIAMLVFPLFMNSLSWGVWRAASFPSYDADAVNGFESFAATPQGLSWIIVIGVIALLTLIGAAVYVVHCEKPKKF